MVVTDEVLVAVIPDDYCVLSMWLYLSLLSFRTCLATAKAVGLSVLFFHCVINIDIFVAFKTVCVD